MECDSAALPPFWWRTSTERRFVRKDAPSAQERAPRRTGAGKGLRTATAESDYRVVSAQSAWSHLRSQAARTRQERLRSTLLVAPIARQGCYSSSSFQVLQSSGLAGGSNNSRTGSAPTRQVRTPVPEKERTPRQVLFAASPPALAPPVDGRSQVSASPFRRTVLTTGGGGAAISPPSAICSRVVPAWLPPAFAPSFEEFG